jgi:hypothetical protein
MSDKHFFTTTKNPILKIEILPVEAMKIKKARDLVKIPRRPTYEVSLPSGKVDNYPLDALAAEQLGPQHVSRWLYYLEERREAVNEQNDAIARTIFFYGTRLKTLPDDGWEEMQSLNGFTIPTQPDLKRAHYLVTELNAGDVSDLITSIMKLSGVTEDEIKEAEDTFRGQVPS